MPWLVAKRRQDNKIRKSTGYLLFCLRGTHGLYSTPALARTKDLLKGAVYAPRHVRESVQAVKCLASSDRGWVPGVHVHELPQVLYKHDPSPCLLFLVCVAHIVLLLPVLKQHLHVILLIFTGISGRGTRGKRGVGGQYPVRRQSSGGEVVVAATTALRLRNGQRNLDTPLFVFRLHGSTCKACIATVPLPTRFTSAILYLH